MRAGYMVMAIVAVALGLVFLLRDPAAIHGNLASVARSVAPAAFATDNTATAGDVNVCIFLIDTLRADRLNVYGYDRHVTSPHMDALARSGVVFEQAYSPAPWTLPSVASLMTSQFPCEHGLVETRQAFAEHVETLPEHLKSIGFTTIGLYANTMVSPAFGFGEGYDFYCESLYNEGAQIAEARRLYAGRPFFLYVHNYEPHNPEYFAPAHTPGFRDVPLSVRARMSQHYRKYRAAVWGDYEAGRPAGSTDVRSVQAEHVQAFVRMLDDYNELYDAAVRKADDRMGSVIDALKRRGEWNSTLFILLSDHGEEMYDHGGWSHDQSVYEEMVRVPLIVKFPRNQYAGTRVREVVSLVDVMPTVLDVIGQADRPTEARGASLRPLIETRGRQPAGAMVVPAMRHNVMSTYPYWQERIGDLNVVVRQDEWKAIWNVEKASTELYDLSTDPREQRNVAAEHPERAEAMRRTAEQWYTACGNRAAASPNVQPNELDEETIRRLRTLGYMG
ncbi:MAG: sulfatase [Phycisphaerales bacterium]|nr:MAG: sulfatase [Phycisphaerales bacterium]